MSRTVCLFGELDPYTGSFPQSIENLPTLINQLKIACLLYDEVIVNANVLFDHALTLPAFQALSLFTKSGVLWTTAVKDQDLPEAYIMRRAQKTYGDNLNTGISKKGTDRVKKFIEQWQYIAPNDWKLTRITTLQQQNATTNVIKNLTALPFLSKSSKDIQSRMIDLTKYMQDRGTFNRNEIIARLGGMRESVSQKEFSQLALIIQGEYMNQGARAHNSESTKTTLFEGKYIQHLQRNNHLFRSEPLPKEFNIVEKINYRLLKSGFPLKELYHLDSTVLFYLSQSTDWKIWRRYILSDSFSIESIREMKSLKKVYNNLLKILSILIKNIDAPCITEKESPNLLLPSSWISSGMGLMGTQTNSINKHQSSPVILDLNARQLEFGKNKTIIEKPYVTLISLLASTGNTGVPIETIKQLDIEIDLVRREFKNTWRSQSNEIEELDIARLNRINVAKSRMNKKLNLFDLHIQVTQGDGIWSLVNLTTKKPVKICLIGTPWKIVYDAESEKFPPPPQNLTKTQVLLWKYFMQRHTSFVMGDSLALEVGKPNMSIKNISDMIYKFKKKLEETPYKIIRSYQGEYCLLRCE